MGMSRGRLVSAVLTGCLVFAFRSVSLGGSGETVGTPWTGAPGVTETIGEIMARDAIRSSLDGSAVRDVRPVVRADWARAEDPSAPAVPQWPPLGTPSPPLIE